MTDPCLNPVTVTSLESIPNPYANLPDIVTLASSGLSIEKSISSVREQSSISFLETLKEMGSAI
jgi:hypothetical protein